MFWMIGVGMVLCVIQIFAFLQAGVLVANDDDPRALVFFVIGGILCLAGGLALIIGGVL